MNFVKGLPLFVNEKNDNYDLILVIINCLTKMVHYKLVKVTINILGLADIIIDVVVQHLSLPDFIINDCGANFISKF